MACTGLEHRRRRRENEDNVRAEDEDTGAEVAPIVKLEEVAVTTGEEDEDLIIAMRGKLYRFDKEGNQWKERGAGKVKILKHKVSGKIRLLMRQSKTLKICANHLFLKVQVQEHPGNEDSSIWHASDFADGELKDELFCIRFATELERTVFAELLLPIPCSESQLFCGFYRDNYSDSDEEVTSPEFVEEPRAKKSRKSKDETEVEGIN